MLKEVFKAPKMMRRRLKNEKIIQKFDRVSDKHYDPVRAELMMGFERYTIDDLFENSGLAAKMRASEMRMLPSNGARVYFSWSIPVFLWAALLRSEKLYDIVQHYIGADVRLDDFYVKNVADGYDATAEGWHDDNVGYRLKVFMVYDVEGVPAMTIIQPQKRPNMYKLQLKEELLRTLKKKNTETKENELAVKYSAGDCLIFDTNISHRGSYNQTSGTRYCVVAEFIDRNKANALRGRAPCGPHQGKGRLIIPDVGIDLTNHRLIDADILQVTENKNLYGYV